MDPEGEGGLCSVGVGGVTKVVGASFRLGGVAGKAVIILCGVVDGRMGVDWVSEATCICGRSSSALEPRLEPNPPIFPAPPNNDPSPPLLLPPDFAGSKSPAGFGDVALLVGVKASLSLSTGEGLRFEDEVTSSVLACLGASVSRVESVSVVAVDGVESIVSEATKGEEMVK